MDKIGGSRRSSASGEHLRTLARLCREHQIELAVECGGTLEFAPLNDQNGERSAAIELTKIRPLTEAGGKLEFVEKEELDFNLIVNSEAGGHASDQAFFPDTLAFVDAYLAAGGSPKRWIVQSWYPHPKAITPETEQHSMTALVKAVIDRIKPARRDRATTLNR